MGKSSVSVVGGSGFIGTRLVERLTKGNEYKPVIVDKTMSSSFSDLTRIADVAEVAELRESIDKDSVIINLAAEHRDDVRPVSLYDRVNVLGAENICKVAREKNVKKIVFTSSVAVYGFAPVGTGEEGKINPFNEYGRTKYEAERIFRSWQSESPAERALVIVRPTVVFGEGNRGNVYSLFRQIANNKFVMIGCGNNRKSMAYVENVAAFLEYGLEFKAGVHIFNYIDKPDFSMNELIDTVYKGLGRQRKIKYRLPYGAGLVVGQIFDLFAFITGKKFPISSIRVKKFCANSMYDTACESSGFDAPVALSDALEKTIAHEFLRNGV